MLVQALWIAVAYVLGSVPWGLVIAKNLLRHRPPHGRQPQHRGHQRLPALRFRLGRGNPALRRAQGRAAGLGRAGHQFVPCLCQPDRAGLRAGGMSFPASSKFKGGKAVATSIGVFLPLAFWQLLIAAALCLLVIWRSGYVSLGSLTLVAALPLLLLLSGIWSWLPLSLCLLALVVWKHRENIARLRAGTEKSWLKSKS